MLCTIEQQILKQLSTKGTKQEINHRRLQGQTNYANKTCVYALIFGKLIDIKSPLLTCRQPSVHQVAQQLVGPGVPSAGIFEVDQQPSVQWSQLPLFDVVLQRINAIGFETPPTAI